VSMVTLAETNFASWVRHNKAFKEYRRIITKPRDFKSKVFLFIGPAGKGKSTVMKLIARYLGTCYKVPQPKGSGTYFDDYDNQDIIMFDEFDGHFMKPTDFNTICDEHEAVLTVHGGAGHQCVAKYIFIGTNYLPKEWWRKRNAYQLKQLSRRIDVVFKMGFEGVERWDHSGFGEMTEVTTGRKTLPRRRPRPGDQYGLDPINGG